MRLNRRYAPDLYLGVVSSADRPRRRRWTARSAARVRGAHAAVRRRDELDALLAAEAVDDGGADPPRHRHRAPARARGAGPADAVYGHPDTVRRVTLDNFAELRRLPECDAEPGTLESLEAGVTARSRGAALMLRDATQVACANATATFTAATSCAGTAG